MAESALDRRETAPGPPGGQAREARVTAEPWRPGHLDAGLLALRAGVWGDDHPHNRPEFYAWLFGDGNPAGAGGGVILRRGDRVLGFMGICPRLARIDGGDVRIAHCVDYMVERSLSAASSGRYAMRLAKEWTRIARADGFAFGIGYPNDNSRRLVTSPRIGWSKILSPRLLVRPLRGAKRDGGSSGLKALGLSLAGAAINLPARLARLPSGTARALATDSPGDAAGIDALWSRLRDGGRLGLVRDAATLHWRYGRHPLRQYRLLGWQAAEGAAGLSALIVTTRRELSGIPSLLIVDGIVDPAAPGTARALVGAALREAAADGVFLAAAEAEPGTAFARALAAAGFVAVPRRLDPKPFTLVGLPLASPQEYFTRSWEFAWGDMDVV